MNQPWIINELSRSREWFKLMNYRDYAWSSKRTELQVIEILPHVPIN